MTSDCSDPTAWDPVASVLQFIKSALPLSMHLNDLSVHSHMFIVHKIIRFNMAQHNRDRFVGL